MAKSNKVIEVRNLVKKFGDLEVVHSINLEIKDAEFLVLAGPSGCGKSTTLRMIAGLEEIDAGTIAIGDRAINDVAPKDRDIAMVFQNYALYPHMSVFENMAYGLKIAGLSKAEIGKKVGEAADLVELPVDHEMPLVDQCDAVTERLDLMHHVRRQNGGSPIRTSFFD